MTKTAPKRKVLLSKSLGGLAVESVPIDSIHADPANVRRHPDKNLASIAASLQRFGQQKPIVVDAKGIIRAGNGTHAAAKSLGWKEISIVRTALAGAEATAFAIADNRSSELAEWSIEDLGLQWGGLDDELKAVTGFDEADMAELLKSITPPVEVVEDEIPTDAPTRCKAGELWRLGEHRLLCGDSTKAEDVARVMGGEKASCIFTDPPYGVSVGAKNRMLNTFQKAGRCLENIASDDMTPEQLKAQLLPGFVLCREQIMAEDCTLFVTAPQGGELGMMMMMMTDAGLRPRHVLIWKKNQPTFSMGRLDYDYAHEPILLTWLKRHKRPMAGQHKTSVWEVDRERKCAEHPTMKPVALYANGYANNSDTGDNVADIYAGSGTAFIAAEQLSRRCFGIEISPKYCDVILARWEKFTGKTAERV